MHPADDQDGVGICFGTVVRREASEHPVLSKQEVAKIAAAAAADALTATGDEEHDGEKGSEEPFFDAFLTAAVREKTVSQPRASVHVLVTCVTVRGPSLI